MAAIVATAFWYRFMVSVLTMTRRLLQTPSG